MHASPADPTSPTRGRILRAEPTRTRVEIGVPGRTILAQSARAIAQARELELRVQQLEAQFRHVGEDAPWRSRMPHSRRSERTWAS